MMNMNQQTPPNPWGSCFDAAAHNLVANRDAMGLCMVHGIGIANREGQKGIRVAHAWLEFEHWGQHIALDPIWLVFQPAKIYRKNLKVEYVVEYTPAEFMQRWREEGFSGPWDDHVMEFTSENLSIKLS